MKNKLFLSLALLTPFMASAVTPTPVAFLPKAATPTPIAFLDHVPAATKTATATASRFLPMPAKLAIGAGVVGAGLTGASYLMSSEDNSELRLSEDYQNIQAGVEKAAQLDELRLSEDYQNIQAGLEKAENMDDSKLMAPFGVQILPSKLERAKEAVNAFSSAIKKTSSDVWGSDRGFKNSGKVVTVGTGLTVAAGLGYLAYTKYAKAKAVKAAAVKVVTPTVVKPVVVAQQPAPMKKKTAKCKNGRCGKRRK